MKLKYILAILILGFLFDIVGALFKIQHWPYGSELLTIGTLIKLVSGILLISKLLFTKKGKEFLNW